MTRYSDKMEAYNRLVERVAEMPSGDERAQVKRVVNRIRELLIEADVAMERDRSPERHFREIDNLLTQLGL